MKKFTKIIIAAAVLLYGLLITGCGAADSLKETIESSYNQWYKYKSNKSIEIPVLDKNTSDSDNESESSDKLKNAEIYFYWNPDDGLTVAVQSITKQEIELLKGLYSTEVEVPMGGTKQYPKEDFGKIKWTALWSSGKLEKSDAPKIVTDKANCIVISGEDTTKPKIQWRKVLANYLLDSLLDD